MIKSSGSRNTPPYPSTFFAGVVVLTLLGGFALFVIQSQALLKGLRESVAVVVELRPEASPQEIAETAAYLEQADFVREASTLYIDKEEGARLLRKEYGEDVLASGLENPLYNLFQFYLEEDYVASQKEVEVVNSLEALSGVLDVYLKENLVSNLAENVQLAGYVGTIIGLLLLAGVVFLLLNTTKLALLSRANLIRNMELVGARWSFISKPFLVRAGLLGFLSGTFAALLIIVLNYGLQEVLPDLWLPIETLKISTLAVGILVLSVLVNLLSTYYVVQKTLRLRVDDLAVLRS